MLTAEEARLKTKEILNQQKVNESFEVSKNIEDAVNNGLYYYTNNGYLFPETRKYLNELGYKVTTGTQYNESYYTIEWSEDNDK